MNNKTLILIGLCICLLFTLPMVSAAEISADSGLIDNSVIESNFDNVDSDIASSIEDDASIDNVVADDGDISQIPAKGEKLSQSNPGNDILSADGSGNTFTDLKILIDKAISSGNPLTLDRDFAFVEGDDDAFKKGIVISSPITIRGDNHIIDANSLARIFVIESDNVFLNGITFKNGKTTDSSDYDTNGGAVYIHGDHTTLENCSFINNTAYEKGGAIYINGSDCILNHTVFRDNIAHDDGGAIAWYGQNGIIYDLNASGNTADGENGNPNGGTLLITGNNINMDKLNISNSRLYKDGGERSLRGGAIFLTGNNCNISNSVFTNCSVDSTVENSSGGAIYVLGNNTNIVNCNFTNNTASEDGGAIYIEGKDCTLNNTVLIGNVAHDDGGAIAWYGQNGIIYDLNASGNTADGENGNPNGGTLLITGNNIHMDKLNISNSRLYKVGGDRALRGGAIFLTGNNCNITNSVFTNCSVESTIENSSGGAIYVLGNNTNIVNCNFTNNTASEDGGAIYIEGKDCTLNKTVFIGNVAHNDGGAIEWNGDNGVIYDLTASRNYADCGNGGSKGGTLLIAGDNMVLDKLNVSNTFVNGEHYSGSSAVQGGALALSGNNCNITNSTFTNCSVVYYKDNSNASGGALYIWGNNTNIVNCNFTNNTASEDGGAIYIEGKDCTLNNTVLIGNVAHNDGGAIEWNGDNGRVYNLTAIGNYADSAEGYYYGNPSEGSSKGGTLVLSGNNMNLEKLNITNSRVFTNHYTGDKPLQGGAVFLTGNNCNISDSIFHKCSVNYNKGKSYGGAMYIIGNNANLSNCNFTNNTAVLGAGAIYIEGNYTFMDDCHVLNSTANDAAGIWISGRQNIINNTNISNNKASNNGGGVYYQGNNNTVSNSIIDHNTAKNGANVYMVANMIGGKLIGCNITNGCASNFGGGVEWLQGSKECLIKDCYFYNDTSGGHGGGVHWYPGTNGQIDNCTFESCHVDKEKNGGAIYAGATGGTQASGTIISNSKFINCTSGSRGVLTWIGNNGLIVNNTFIDCGKSSGSTNYGGVQAIQIQQGNNNQIIGCNFTNCTSTLGGGAIRLQGDGSNLVNNITIADCHFDNCTAQESAGAVYMNYTAKNVKFENNTFTGNHAPNYGALFIDDAATISSFVNNNFTNNSATASDGNGGAARLHANINVVNSTFTANSCNGFGGAIYTASNLEVSGSTFENNTAKYGGAIATENSNLVVDQSIFKYNKAESGSAINAATIDMSNTELLENQASFDKWENENYLFADDHLTVSGTFVGKDNLLNGIKANSGTFNNVTYCGVNGGGVGEGTTNTDDVLSANSYNEVHQIVVMEVYDVNGELKYNLTNYTDEDGNYNFDLSLDGAVVSLVKVYHPEDNYYTGAEYEIVRVPSKLDIDCENIYVDDEERITFKVTGKDTPTGNITVFINDTDGNVIFNDTISLNGSGEANITLTGLNASQYYIYAIYNGDNDYIPDDETAQFNVSKWNSTVEVVPIPSIIYGSLEDINITVSSDGTSGNFTGNLIMNITSEDAIGFENISQIIITIGDDGKVIDWTINDMILPVGNYTIAVAYSGNYKYNGNSSKAKFTVNPIDSSVTVDPVNITYGEDEIIKYNVTDGATGNVTITITGDALDEPIVLPEVPIVNGTVGVVVADLLGGNYTVNVTYNGDNNFNPSSAVANFSVGKATPSVNVNTTYIDYHDSESIKVNVTGVDGDIPTGNVTVVVFNETGGVVYNQTHNLTNGAVTVHVDDLVAGKYNVTVSYNGDDNYRHADGNANFTVNKIDPSILVNASDIDYHDSETINVTVNDDATGTVSITVKNETGDVVYSNSSELSGSKASFTVPDLSAGKYNVTVEYSGDNNYNAEIGKANFTVNKIDTPVNLETENITYGEEETISVSVNDDATGSVTITIYSKDDTPVYSETVPIDEASAQITVPGLNAGNYTVHVDYSGDGNYKTNSTEGKFEVAKADAIVEIHVYDIIYGDIEELTVTCNAPGTVTIYVNGASVTLPLENGYGHILFASWLSPYSGKAQWDLENLAAGTYPAKVHYNGNENYNEAEDEDVFNVLKKETSVTVSVDDIKVGEDAVINVELSPSAAPGKLTITVDGKEYTVTPKNGKASIKVPGLKAGNHTVTVSYPGSENYTESSNETTFAVSKVKPDIDVSAPTIKVGEDGKITVTLPKDATGKVTIEIDGKNYTSQIKDGKAVFTVSGLKVGKHSIKVFYTGDDKYESSVVDGGYIKVIEDNNNGSNDHKGHANGIDLSTKATGNPVLALLFVLVFLGIIPLKRKKDEEDED